MNSSVEERRIRHWIDLWDNSNQHRTGTDGDRETTAWLAQEISDLGAKPIIHEFPFNRRVPHSACVSIGTTTLDGVPMFDGGTTSDEGVTGVVSQSAQEGCVYLFNPRRPDIFLDELRRDPRILGILVESYLAGPRLALLNADRYENPFGPPVLQVSSDHGSLLVEAAMREENAKLVVRFDEENTTATNVQTTVEGLEKELPPLVVMTPKSAWYTCTAERIGGIVSWLECIRQCVSQQPKRTVIFTANTGHELGHVGLKRYLESDSSLIARSWLWVHFGANFAATECQIRLQCSADDKLAHLRSRLRERGIDIANVVGPRSRPGGEARDIFDAGGEYTSILGSNRLFHHPADRYESNVDLQRLLQIKRALVECVSLWASSV